MSITITETSTGRILWLAEDCAEHCGIGVSTWHSYSRNGNRLGVPEPVHRIGRSPLWDAEEVKAWHANRPGSPVPNAPTSTRKS